MVHTGLALSLRKEELLKKMKAAAPDSEEMKRLETELSEVQTKLSAGGLVGGSSHPLPSPHPHPPLPCPPLPKGRAE
jgi:hypothetical protein